MANKNINILLALKDQFSKPLKNTTAATKAAQKQIKACSNVIKGWANSANAKFKSVAGTAAKIGAAFLTLGGALSIAGIKAWSGEAMETAKKQIDAETKLEAVLGNVKSLASGGAAAVLEAKKNLMGVASALQKVGVIGDEVTLAGMQQLATFQLSDKEIGMLSKGMTDLLAQQKGLNATQEDAVTIGNMIGKVMQGQTSALSRVGITFDAAQEKALKLGTAEERAATLAEILQQNVGGVNQALAETDQGKIQQTANLYGDMQEEVGKGLLKIKAQFAGMAAKVIPLVQEKLVGAVARLQERVNDAIEYLKAHKEEIIAGLNRVKTVASAVFGAISKAVGWIIQHFDTLGPILAGVVAGFAAFNVILPLISAFKTLKTVILGLKAASTIGAVFTALGGPIVLIPVAIAAVVAAVTWLWKHCEGFRDFVMKAWQAVCAAFDWVKEHIAFLFPFFGLLISAGIAVYKNWDVIKEKALKLWGRVKEVFGGIRDSVTGAFNSIKEAVAGAVGWIASKIAWLGEGVQNFVVAVQQAIGFVVSWAQEHIMILLPFFGLIISAGVAICTNWDTIKTKALELWEKVKEVFGGIRESITGAFTGAREAVTGAVDWIAEKIGSIGNAIEKVPVLGDIFRGVRGFAEAFSGQKTTPSHATGTSYFAGGATRVNEGGRGEIVDLPSGSRIIPHGLSQKEAAGGPTVNVSVTVQGNVIGNREFMEQTGEFVADKVITALGTV